jgi:CheY-like chemotaxis protein
LKDHTVLFPLNSDSNLMITQTASEIAKQVILIVDDDEAVRESLRRLMESEGFAVHAFSNGHDLLNEASLPAIGCLVVDYQMPAMNGLELVCALRGRGVRAPLFSSQAIRTSTCATRLQQSLFWSSRNPGSEIIWWTASVRRLQSEIEELKPFPDVVAALKRPSFKGYWPNGDRDMLKAAGAHRFD